MRKPDNSFFPYPTIWNMLSEDGVSLTAQSSRRMSKCILSLFAKINQNFCKGFSTSGDLGRCNANSLHKLAINNSSYYYIIMYAHLLSASDFEKYAHQSLTIAGLVHVGSSFRTCIRSHTISCISPDSSNWRWSSTATSTHPDSWIWHVSATTDDWATKPWRQWTMDATHSLKAYTQETTDNYSTVTYCNSYT